MLQTKYVFAELTCKCNPNFTKEGKTMNSLLVTTIMLLNRGFSTIVHKGALNYPEHGLDTLVVCDS